MPAARKRIAKRVTRKAVRTIATGLRGMSARIRTEAKGMSARIRTEAKEMTARLRRNLTEMSARIALRTNPTRESAAVRTDRNEMTGRGAATKQVAATVRTRIGILIKIRIGIRKRETARRAGVIARGTETNSSMGAEMAHRTSLTGIRIVSETGRIKTGSRAIARRMVKNSNLERNDAAWLWT